MGTLRFDDELGNAHERSGVLWQFFEVGEAARLHVDAPHVVRSPDAFVVRARYADADGHPIPGGHVTASLVGAGRPDHQFSLPKEGDAHVLRWSTMREWTPPWPRGDVDVVLEANDEHGRHLALTWRGTVRFA